MLSKFRPVVSGSMFLIVVGLAGLTTWLCVGWFGHQAPLAAMVAVLLVELILASVGVIAILLTERLTVTLLNAEKRPPAPPKSRPQQTPIWRRLPDAAVGEPGNSDPLHQPQSDTIAFPNVDREPVPSTPNRLNRAA